jgi:phosphoglycolate phosphatase-like HAD superfamily hydrolase
MSAHSHDNQLPAEIQQRLSMLVFDLDGVITSEQRYWDTARRTVYELLEDEHFLGLAGYFGEEPPRGGDSAAGDAIIPTSQVYALKNQAVNSNWDLTYMVAALHITAVLHASGGAAQEIFRPDIPLQDSLRRIGQQAQQAGCGAHSGMALIERFLQDAHTLQGAALIEHIQTFACNLLAAPWLPFAPGGDLWRLCFDRFQFWYEQQADEAITERDTVVELAQVDRLLRHLQQSGRYVLGIATGRPHQEAIRPLAAMGLLHYFEERRIITSGHVLEAQRALQQEEQGLTLGKPHPFVLFRAIYPERAIAQLVTLEQQDIDHSHVAFIGDTPSDVLAARRARCVSIGVLTGSASSNADRARKRQQLQDSGAHIVLNHVLELWQALGIAAPSF